ncbi:MAG: PVC-type heme-binding CxxCH protein, partial [Isosphaeraceae bacterium]
TRGVTPTTDRAGGGHAHSGAAIYLGNLFPPAFRNTVFMGNIHGNRVNHDRLERSGSGYRATHQPDFLLANDRWFRTVAQKVGPEGALYVLDWSDTGECHEQDADGAHRENGRIYRVAYGTPVRPAPVSPENAEALAALQSSPNEFLVRRARRLLQERAAGGADLAAAHRQLRKLLGAEQPEGVRLRALWALHASGGIDAEGLVALLSDRNEDLRAWSVRLLADDRGQPVGQPALDVLAGLAKSDPSARVRLALASTLQRLPRDRGVAIGEALIAHAEDASDPNLPLMVWYGVEPVVPLDLARAARWASDAALPMIRRNAARRAIAADPERGLDAIVDRLAAEGVGVSPDAIQGVVEGLEGRRAVRMPKAWPTLATKLRSISRYDFRPAVARLSLTFGDSAAIAELRRQLGDSAAPIPARAEALDALASARVPGLVADLLPRLDEPALRSAALTALASYDDATIPTEVLKRYARFSTTDREVAVQTLAARPVWAVALLEAVGRGDVPRRDLAVSVARQLQSFHRAEVDEALARHWGTLRPTSADKAALMSKYKALLTPDQLRTADLSRGRATFEATCRQCHKLYGEGGDIGPELTGSNRDNLDYVLENVLDPSATVAGDYRVANIATTDGRLVTGLLREQTPAAVVVQTLNGRVVIPRGEIEELRPTAASMMPEGLFEKLSDAEVRDLVAYLASRSQVPLPAR